MSVEKQRKIGIIKKMIAIIQKLLVLYRKQMPVLIVLHHSATDRDKTRAEAIEKNHKERGYPKSRLGKHTAYNVVIEGSGKTTYARDYRDYNETGWAVSGISFHIDICLTGNFEQEKPSREQIGALEKELALIQNIYKNIKIKGHKDFRSTLCPGRNLYKFIHNIHNDVLF